MQGMFDGTLARLDRESKEIHEAECTGDFEINNQFVQIKVEHNGQEIWADVVSPMGGSRVAIVSTPTQGARCLIAMPQGQINNAFFLGYVSTPTTGNEAPGDVAAGGHFIISDGAPLLLRSNGSTLTLDNGTTSVALDGDTTTIKSGGAQLEVSSSEIKGSVGTSTLEMTQAGKCKMSNTQGAYFECSAEGFVDMGNAAGSVLGLIRTLATGCQTGTVPTLLGPQLLVSPKFAQVLAQVTLIKGA